MSANDTAQFTQVRFKFHRILIVAQNTIAIFSTAVYVFIPITQELT
jgi:hypothetical protein